MDRDVIRPLGVPASASREKTVARAVLIAKSYMREPNVEILTERARDLISADPQRTATDIAYLLVRYDQRELPL